ncbi:MAG: sulfotransferase domain-containing protein [Alphaproteobacteria bacterium]
MARHEVPKGYTVALIATMPRSGTWMSFYFLEFLDLYLSGRTTLNTRLDLEVYHALRLGKVHIHTTCPGFVEHCQGPVRSAWDALSFYNPGYDYGYGRFIAGNEAVFSPLKNPAIRIVYIYRNPLDQCVSFFRHTAKHRQDSTRTFIDGDGAEIKIADARDFLRRVGMEAYIKQYLTFHVMNERCAGNLLMLPYERMVRDRDGSFRALLAFLGCALDSDEAEACFQKALNSSSASSLRNLEKSLGASLGRDQSDAGESHIRGGKIGKWKQYYDEADVEFAEQALSAFGLSLDGFEIE